ncbi:MAG: MFS transporter [Candidatus Kariarchaeaceae archaeon]|jgi:DHA1 family multidrug resistance protein-like MFS transporter
MEHHKGHIWFLTIITLLVHTGFGIIFPIMPKVLDNLDKQATELGIIAAAYGITYVIFSPIYGNFADKKGKKITIVIGLVGFTISNIIYIIATLIGNYLLILLARAIEGAFSAAIFPAAISMVSDLVPENERGKNIGYVTAGNGVGLIIGPVLGGYLFEISLNAPFYFSAIVAAITVVWAVQMLPNTPILISSREKGTLSLKSRLREDLLRLPLPRFIFILFVLVDMSILLTWMLVEPGFSFYIYDDLNLTPKDFGTFVAAYGVFVAIGEGGLGTLSDKFGRRPLIFLGFIINTLFYFVLLSATSFIQLVIAASLAGIGLGLVGPAMKAMISEASIPEFRTTTLGVVSGLVSIGTIVGPIIGGMLFDMYSMSLIIYISIGLGVLGSIGSVFLKFDLPTSLPTRDVNLLPSDLNPLQE